MTLVRRALKVLADREVSPQLGVLKSTLLQLDPTFSEREYGASTFRDLVQRLGRQGYVTLKGSDRNIYVELREGPDPPSTPAIRDADSSSDETPEAAGEPPAPEGDGHALAPATDGVAIVAQAVAEPREHAPAPSPAATPTATGQQLDGYRTIHDVFIRPGVVARWPLYLRQVKQIIRGVDETFDERRYGFTGMVEALRFGQREGLFRLDRDRQGVLRVYPGPLLQRQAPATDARLDSDAAPADDVIAETTSAPDAVVQAQIIESGEQGEEPSQRGEEARPVAEAEGDGEPEVARAPRRRSATKKAVTPRKPTAGAKPRGRSAAPPRKPARKPQ